MSPRNERPAELGITTSSEDLVRAAHAPGGVLLRTRTRSWIVAAVLSFSFLALAVVATVVCVRALLRGEHVPQPWKPAIGVPLLVFWGLLLARTAWHLNPHGPEVLVLTTQGLCVRRSPIGWDEIAVITPTTLGRRLHPSVFEMIHPFGLTGRRREAVGIDLTDAGWTRRGGDRARTKILRSLSNDSLIPLNPNLRIPAPVLAEAMNALRAEAFGHGSTAAPGDAAARPSGDAPA